MPGTLLLADLERSNGDELAEHLQSLYGSSTSTPTPVIQPPAPAPQPDAMQELGGHLQNLLGGGLNVIGEGLSNVGQAAANVSQQVPAELQTHVTNLLQPEPPPPPPPPPPAPAAPVPAAQGEAVPTSEGVNPNPTPEEVRGYIAQAAQARGIDPGIALKVAQSEGGFEAARRGTFKTGSSWWPFQLHYGGPGYENLGDTAGMGNAFTQKTGFEPGDPNAWQAATDYALDRVKQAGWGDWYGAKAQGITGFQGVDRSSVPPAGLFEAAVERGKQAGSAVAGAVRGAAEAVVDKVQGADQDVSQFGDKQLTAAEANAACGPAAAVRFAQRFGRNPTLREATDLASSVGWTSGQGMAGIGSEQKLLQKMGVETKLVAGPQWDQFAAEAQTGNPVTISTSAHYFYADGYNPETGQFHVGRSGTDLRGGKEWMTRDEIVGAAQRLGGGTVQGALFANNPNAPTSTTQAFTSPTAAGASDVPGLVPSAGQVAPAPEERGLVILDDAIDRSVKGGSTEQRAASVSAREETPLIQAPEPPRTALESPTRDLGGLVPSAGRDELGVTPAAFSSPSVQDEQSGLERFGRGILGGVGEALGGVGERVQPALEGLGETVGPLLDTSQRPLSPGAPLRESIANAPVLGGALGLARGPMLLEDQELLQQATPAEIETARKYATLTNPNPTEEDVVGVLRGFRTGEAAAMAEAGPGAGAARTAGRAARQASRGIDYDMLARLRDRSNQLELPDMPSTTPNAADRAIAFSVNNMLSNPASMIANAAGGLMETVKRPLVTAATGDLGAAGTDLRAQGLAIGDALSNAGTAFTTGRRASRAVDQPEAFEGAGGMVVTPFLRAMGATDEFIYSLSSAGAQGSKLVQLMRANPTLNQAEVMQRFGNDILEAGQRAAKEATFQVGGTGMGEALAGARRGLTAPDASVGERVKGAAAQVLTPFSVVPDVLLSRGVTRVPVLNEIRAGVEGWKALKAGDPTAAKRAAAGAALAEATNLAIWTQVQEGNITGSGPDDPAKRRALMNARDENGNPLWRPNSIKVANQWVPYSSLGGVAVQLGAIANGVEQYEAAGKQVNPDMAKAFGAALGETVTDAWYLQTLSGAFTAIQNGQVPEWMGTQALSTAGRAIPEAALLNTLKKLTDPTAREAEPKLADPRTWLEYFAARVPGASETVKPKLDPATGRPIEEPQTVSSVLTRGTAPGEPSPVNELLARHNLGAPEPPKTITTRSGATVTLTEPEQRRFLEVAGPEIENLVLEMGNDPDFQQADPKVQRDLLQKMIAAGRRIATASMFEGLPEDELLRRIEQSREAERRQAEPSVRLP